MTKPVIIIAEAGVNHNGDMAIARKLIEVAGKAGADYVKFQSFIASEVLTVEAPKASYQLEATGDGESQCEMIRRLELSVADHDVLIKHCRDNKIKFCSTAFNPTSIQLLSALELDFFKVPSGEIDNVPYLRSIARLRRPIILSTGMSSLSEVEFAIVTLTEAGASRKDITVLHCNTEYPTPMEDVNLRAMQTIRDAFKIDVGYSDHTPGIEVPIAAVALGAKVIEKHFTLDRQLPGPDHAASLEPNELAAMVKAIRHVESALGDGIKRPSVSELPNRDVVRKSIVAARDISEGEILTSENLAVKRPGTGVSPKNWDKFIGRRAERDYGLDELLEW